jgi:hypothetical protein
MIGFLGRLFDQRMQALFSSIAHRQAQAVSRLVRWNLDMVQPRTISEAKEIVARFSRHVCARGIEAPAAILRLS